MTPAEIANKWQMNRYRTPGQIGGMDNKEYFDLMTEDVAQCAEEIALSFTEWLTRAGSPYAVLYGEKERWCDEDREYTTAELFQLYKQSI